MSDGTEAFDASIYSIGPQREPGMDCPECVAENPAPVRIDELEALFQRMVAADSAVAGLPAEFERMTDAAWFELSDAAHRERRGARAAYKSALPDLAEQWRPGRFVPPGYMRVATADGERLREIGLVHPVSEFADASPTLVRLSPKLRAGEIELETMGGFSFVARSEFLQ